MAASVLWSETPDEEGGDDRPGADEATPAKVDESLPSRRLRHWLKAMFGGQPKPKPPDEPPSS